MTFHLITAFLTIAAADFDGLVAFYRGLFTQEPKPLIPDVYAEFNFPGLCLAIFRPKDSNASEFNHSANSSMSICLEVDSLEDAIERLRELGQAPTGNIMVASHGREVYAYDPIGNRIILHQS